MYIRSEPNKTCPKCKEYTAERDFNTGPGKWYWCNNCGDYTIYPNQQFLTEIRNCRQQDNNFDTDRR